MKTALLILATTAALFAAYATTAPTAACQWCSPVLCFNSASCGSGCACFKGITDPTGSCHPVAP